MAQPVDPDTAIALRQVHAFPPARLSTFEDPADEKSSRGSQRYSALKRYFEDRQPAWYESITREFAGLPRVLDLGTGPGLTLDALRGHGVSEAIGVDRLHGFLRDAEGTGRRVILHDLTLPMPFFRSGSFDGLFSHFALDYMSPIGVQQVLREARRLLAPGGLMALHLSTAGLALGDPARTSPYDEPALTRLLRSAGFDEFEIAVPEADREVAIVHARGPGLNADGVVAGASAANGGSAGAVIEREAGGEIQLAAGARVTAWPEDAPAVSIEVADAERSLTYRPRLAASEISGGEAIADLSVCARLVAVGPERFELQAWTWRGERIAAIETAELRFRPELIHLRIAGELEHGDVWRPAPPMLEPPGDAYTIAERASAPRRPDEAWRARGRQVIVERPGDDPDLLRGAAGSEDHFLIHRPDVPTPPDIAGLEMEWAEARLDGIVLELEEALRAESLPLLLWAGFRGALVYLESSTWDAVAAVAESLPGSLRPPVLIVDPELSGAGEAEGQAEVELPEKSIAALLDTMPNLHLVLSGSTARRAARLSERYSTRLLLAQGELAGADGVDERLTEEATENLRYLSERTALMRLRGAGSGLPGHLVQMCG